ncbi:unnamed protein product [Symbiodinium sp. CCMP2592]|nr:unnamed protein product [Symbiodinium sp. CCMP2592]
MWPDLHACKLHSASSHSLVPKALWPAAVLGEKFWDLTRPRRCEHVTACFEKANIVTSSAAMSACARGSGGNSWSYTLNLACQVGVKGMRPTSVSFGALLTAFQKASFWEQSLLALGTLSESSLGLDVQTAGAALAACALSRRWFEVSDILQKLQMVDIQPDAWMREWALKSQGAGQSASDIRSLGAGVLQDLRSLGRCLGCQSFVILPAVLVEEEEQLAESQDTQYVAMREQIDKKAVHKRTQQLHFLDAEKPNKHVVFVDEDDLGEPGSSSSSSSQSVGKRLKDFNLAEYFDTHPMLLQRKANRLRLKQLETKLLTQPESMAVQAETRIQVNGPQASRTPESKTASHAATKLNEASSKMPSRPSMRVSSRVFGVLQLTSMHLADQDVVIYDRFDRAIPVLQDAYVPDAGDFPLRACVKARSQKMPSTVCVSAPV